MKMAEMGLAAALIRSAQTAVKAGAGRSLALTPGAETLTWCGGKAAVERWLEVVLGERWVGAEAQNERVSVSRTCRAGGWT